MYWDGTLLSYKARRVYYDSPKNVYERAMEELRGKYAIIWECRASEPDWQDTVGITYKTGYGRITTYKVIISYKDPFVVYHEMTHILN